MGYFPIHSNKKPIPIDWLNYQGQPEGNYGYALPHDILVVDVDFKYVDKEQSFINHGQNSEKFLLDNNMLPPTKIVTTAHAGGKHYYYFKPENFKIRKKLPELKGIDFLSYGSYVVGEGSVINGITYQSNGEFMVEAPLKLLEFIQRQEVVDPKPPADVNIDDLKKICGYIPVDLLHDYDTWTKIGMAIHDATNGSQQGLDIWDVISQKSDKWVVGECAKKWGTFSNRGSKITVNTLYMYAIRGGYSEVQGDVLSADIQAKKPLDLYDELKDWVYITAGPTYFNVRDRRLLDAQSMRSYYKILFKKGDVLASLNQQLQNADSYTYKPHDKLFIKEDGVIKLNRWKGSDIKPEEGDASILEEHFKYLLPNEWFILRNYLAWIIQKPKERLEFSLVLSGGFGIGKSFLGRLMMKLLHTRNVSTPTNKMIHDKFTDWCGLYQLILVNEFMGRDRRDFIESLKEYITEPTVMVREMHTPAYRIQAHFAMMFFTNHQNSLVLEDENDRRFCILHSDSLTRDKSYYDKLFDILDNKPGIYLNYLLNVDLSMFDHRRPPFTTAKKRLIEQSESSNIRNLITEFLTERTIFTLSELVHYILTDIPDPEIINERRLSYMIASKCKFVTRTRYNKIRYSFYAVNSVADYCADKGNAEIISLYLEDLKPVEKLHVVRN